MNKKPQPRAGKVTGIVINPKEILLEKAKETEQESDTGLKFNVKEADYHRLSAVFKDSCPDQQVEPRKKKTIPDYLTIKTPLWVLIVMALITATVVFITYKVVPQPTTPVQREIVWKETSRDSTVFLQHNNEKATKMVTIWYKENK